MSKYRKVSDIVKTKDLENCLQAVYDGESYSRAARKFNIKLKTLYRCIINLKKLLNVESTFKMFTELLAIGIVRHI